jgi:S-adenosylmethionine-diacylglycerol 3-amino-3-carboxypropyl transferase
VSIPLWNPIPFSITAEDMRVVERALAPREGSVLLCIGSSGDTPLGLLTSDVSRIDVIDASFPQLCLATLKATAMKHLTLPEYRTLLGVTRDGDRAAALFERIQTQLPAEVAAFWRRHRRLIKKGLIWQGGLVRQIALTRRLLRALVGARWLERLALCQTTEQATALLEELLRSRRGRALVTLSANPVVRLLYYPSGTFRRLPRGSLPQHFLVEKGRAMLRRRSLADNPYLYPFAFGRYASKDCVPPYLSEEFYDVIRMRVDRLHFVHADLRQHLSATRPRSYDGLSLSNAVDWMSQSETEDLLGHIARVGEVGARALLFSRSTTVEVPPALAATLESDAALGGRLLAEDRTGYYNSVNVLRVIG